MIALRDRYCLMGAHGEGSFLPHAVAAWNKKLRLNRVVAYALAGPKIAGTSFQADGAAMHSNHSCYRLQFKCDLTPDRKKVVSFEFLVGEEIPKQDWDRHNLPEEN